MELLTKSKSDTYMVTFQDKEDYKQILLQSNAHRGNYISTGKIKAKKASNIRCLYLDSTDKKEVPWESLKCL